MTDDKYATAAKELVQLIIDGEISSSGTLERYKRLVAGKYKLAKMFSNSLIIKHIPESTDEDKKRQMLKILTKRLSRTISGISVVAVMTPPSPCPGKCIYCPRGENAAQSYTGREPAAMRGIQHNYDPYEQVTARINQLRAIGHVANKVHLIIMGGTFPAQSHEYQDNFMLGCMNAISEREDTSIDEAIQSLENSSNKNVGITFETRPDFCYEEHIDRMLYLGGTWVEIGVQSLIPEILENVHRGHTLDDIRNSIRLSKDSGLKVTLHMMPNLLVTPKQDIEIFKALFEDENYRPDSLKIYPTLVIENTELYDMWLRKEYEPYPEEDVVKMLAEVKDTIIPEWTRIMRIQRDIPVALIEDGVKHGNLREIVHSLMKENNQKCNCIRCREIGHRMNKEEYKADIDSINLTSIVYKASGSIEHFISFVDKENTLFGFIRLRITENSHRPEARGQLVGFIRELHVYGSEVATGEEPKSKYAWQHKGIGKELILAAEKEAQKAGVKKVLITSGAGVRNYYKKFGYYLEGFYMVKEL